MAQQNIQSIRTSSTKQGDLVTEVTTSVELMTPAMAEQILKNNRMGNNRRVRQSRVDYYSAMIKRNAWDLNGETIKIASDGQLLDGQHRLLAVVQADSSVEMVVVRGVDPESFATIDDGLGRSYGDHLYTNGHRTNAGKLGAAAKVCMGFNKQGNFKRIYAKVPPDVIVRYVEENPALVEACRYMTQLKKLMPASVGIALYHMFSIVDAAAAELFFDSMFSGANLHDGDPILTLRNRLLTRRKDLTDGATDEVVHLVVTAFNKYRKSEKLFKMVFTLESQTLLEGFEGQLSDRAFLL